MALYVENFSLPSIPGANEVHFMPCNIEHNGTAKVSSYFSTSISDCSANEAGFMSSFRGRPLHGEKKTIPEGYTGLVLKEYHKTFDEQEDRKAVVTQQFTEFNYWNLDLPPSGNDKLVSAFQWVDIAKAIHDPLDTKEDSKVESAD